MERVEFPSLEVSKEVQQCPGLGDKVLMGQRLDLMTLEFFSNVMILGFCEKSFSKPMEFSGEDTSGKEAVTYPMGNTNLEVVSQKSS
ncbi:hypothetical protein BTVI_35935 [Pitangus sulphuratus]|nr:hypothetical protein BTVI_35935 [Pitangus sulphuratus]